MSRSKKFAFAWLASVWMAAGYCFGLPALIGPPAVVFTLTALVLTGWALEKVMTRESKEDE